MQVDLAKDGEQVGIAEWSFGVVEQLLKVYNEPLLNLHFLSPYVKDQQASLGCYECIFDMLPLLPDEGAANFIDLLRQEIAELKRDMQ